MVLWKGTLHVDDKDCLAEMFRDRIMESEPPSVPLKRNQTAAFVLGQLASLDSTWLHPCWLAFAKIARDCVDTLKVGTTAG